MLSRGGGGVGLLLPIFYSDDRGGIKKIQAVVWIGKGVCSCVGHFVVMLKPAPARWPRLLSVEGAAEYFSVSANTLRALPIPTVRIGHRVLYDRLALDAWVESKGDFSTSIDLDFGLDEQPAEDWRQHCPGLNGSLAPTPAKRKKVK